MKDKEFLANKESNLKNKRSVERLLFRPLNLTQSKPYPLSLPEKCDL